MMDIWIERTSCHQLRARQESDSSGFIAVIPYLENCELAFRVTIRVRSKKTADRLVKAIEAGVALTEISVQRDLFLEEYIASTLRVRMNSIRTDLTRLGF